MVRVGDAGDDEDPRLEVDTDHLENPEDHCLDVETVTVDKGRVNRRVVASGLSDPEDAFHDAFPIDGDSEDDSKDHDFDGFDGVLSGEVSRPDDRDLPLYEGERPSREEVEYPSTVTSDEDVETLYGRVARVKSVGKHEHLYLAGRVGTTTVRLDGRLDAPNLRQGDVVVVADLKRDSGENGLAWTQTLDSCVVVVNNSTRPRGYRLERRTALVQAHEWYSNDDIPDWKAEQYVKENLLNEYEIETPRGQDDDMMMYIDAPGNDRHGTWTPNGEGRLREILDNHLPEWKNNQRTKNSIVCSLRDRTRVPEDKWDDGAPESEAVRWSVGVQNGVIDLRTGELHDHGPEWQLRAKLPVEYRPDEYDGLGDEFDWFLTETMKTDSDKESFLYMVGHALARCYPTESVWSLTGPGKNGKTRLLEAIEAFLGDCMGDFSLKTMAGDYEFGAGALKGANLVIDDDATAVKLSNTEDLKKHSGGRGGSINVKREKIDGDAYRNYATIAFLSNDPPMFGDKTEGMKRRMHPVIMPYQFSNDPTDNKKDAVPKDEIRRRLQKDDELEALLCVAVEYAQQIYDDGEVQDGRKEEERWELYENYSDGILRFWRDCMTSEPGARVTRNAVYETYVQWCEMNGVDPKQPGGKNGFWPLSDQCHGVSYNRDSVTVDGSRAVEHVKFDVDAMDHAPTWVREKWESDVEDEDSVLANRLDRVTALADLDGGYCTTEARVIGRDHADMQDETGVKLTLEDDTTAIDAVAWGDEFDGVRVGDKIRLERAVLTQYRSVPQLKVKAVTEVAVVEPGPLSEEEFEESVQADPDDGEDDGDGEYTGLGDKDEFVEKVYDELARLSDETGRVDREEAITEATSYLAVGIRAVNSGIKSLKVDGRLYDAGGGELKIIGDEE